MAKAIVTGWKELDAAFAQLEVKIQGKALRGALRAGAQRIQAAAVQNLVNSPSVDTGKLATGLKVRSTPRSRVRVGMEIITQGAAHANLVEYGTKRMPAEPFLRPAGYDNKEYIAAMLLDDIAAAAKSPTWDFKKLAAGGVTAARRKARKIATKNKRAKAKKVRARFKKFEQKMAADRERWEGGAR